MDNREKYRKWLHSQQEGQDLSGLDDLDRKSVEGYRYLAEDSNFEDAMARLDQRMGALLGNESSVPKTAKKPEAKVRSINLGRLLSIAAAVALVVAAVMFFGSGNASGEQLYADYFEAPQSTYLLTSRGEGSMQQEGQDLSEAFALYEKGNYQEAEVALQSLIESYPEKEDLKFYRAICLLGSDQTSEAITLFEQCQSSSFQDIDQRSRYYLGLAYLKLGQEDQALQWLGKALGTVVDDKAQRVLDAME